MSVSTSGINIVGDCNWLLLQQISWHIVHTSIMEGFKKSGPRCTKTIILDYIRPVESNGDTFEILGWGCTILILASFERVQRTTRRKHGRTKSFQIPYKHESKMTFLLQAQKLIMWNAWFLTKLIRDHDSKTSSFSQTTTTLHIQCCRSSVFRVMTSD